MKLKKTKFKDLYILLPTLFKDDRGVFFESYSRDKFKKLGIHYKFIQDNHSYTKTKYTFRGLHYQLNPKSQTTLVRVASGKILDIVVDLRKNSSTYGTYITNILSSKNKKQLLIPKGFAHGFLTLTNNVNVIYKMDEYYYPKYDRILNVRDKTLNIDLNISWNNIKMAKKDTESLFLDKIQNNFY